MHVALLYILAYLLGSIPFGLLIAKSKGIDIREHGSGNIGATNVFRVVGKKFGITCFVLDFGKGFCGAFALPLAFGLQDTAYTGLIAGALTIAGHNWPVFLKFKGGKGIATSGGVLAAVAPLAVGVALLTWIVLFITSRYVSLASVLAAAAVTITGWVQFAAGTADLPTSIILTLLGAAAIWRHRSNLQRLAKGEEHRFSFSKKKSEPSTEEESA